MIKAPTLILYGAADPVIPVAASITRLEAIEKHQPNIVSAVVADADHEMMTGLPPAQEVDPALNGKKAPDSAEYFARLSVWLQQQGLVSHR